MKIKNETEIQLMKILFKTSGKKPTKNITSRRAYPYGIEKKYSRQLQGFFKSLTDYVENFINQNMEPLLRGDSKDLHLDAIPGDTFRNMIYNLENWLSVYMPDISELPEDRNNNVILAALGKTAEEAMEFGNKEFSKMLDKGIHVNLPTSANWWNDMKSSWAEDNYTLITSNAKNYVSKINTLTEQAIVNGMSPKKLSEEIFKATESLTKKHCKLLARDQMGKLNGQITQAQMEEIGLDMYVWSTAFDDRVRDSHAAMEGLLCRWDDASVCSYDGGKTWVDRPSGAVTLHPGQDIQCRCVGLAYYPELTAEIEGKPLEEITEGLPPVQDLPQFQTGDLLQDYIKDGLATKTDEFKDYIINSFENTNYEYQKVMRKIAAENKKSVYFAPDAKYSHFDPAGKRIVIKSIDDINTSVLRHEMGHFFDYAIGETRLIEDKVFGGKIEHRFQFSLLDKFSKSYEKEAKKMIAEMTEKVKGTITGKIYSYTVEDKVRQYVMGMRMGNRDFACLSDIFTAFTKKEYGGHPVKYFHNPKLNKRFPELKFENRNTEGFAELCEIFFNKNLSKDAEDFFNTYFPDTKKIILEAVKNYGG